MVSFGETSLLVFCPLSSAYRNTLALRVASGCEPLAVIMIDDSPYSIILYDTDMEH